MKRIALITLVMILAAGALAGCGAKEESGDSGTGTEVTGNVVTAGSTSVQPLSEELAAVFMDENEGITVEVQGGGSGQGMKAIQEKIADFGALSRNVKDEEKSAVVKEYVIAKDGVAVIVNPESKVENLTIEQIKKIYTGEIKNWSEVGGEDAPIVVVSREEGSGTRGRIGRTSCVFQPVRDTAKSDKGASIKSLEG